MTAVCARECEFVSLTVRDRLKINGDATKKTQGGDFL